MAHHVHRATRPSRGEEYPFWVPPRSWRRPTFGEFLDRVRLEFGSAVDSKSLLLLGLGRDERLTPGDIEALCGQLGVPAEDFGVDP